VINIFFVAGTFGSTVEYVLRSHTKEYTIEPSDPLPDGSMHGFIHQAHLQNTQLFFDYFNNQQPCNNIATILYPKKDLDLVAMIDYISGKKFAQSKNILIYCDDFDFAEQNLLFQYHKIAFGHTEDQYFKIFTDLDTIDFTKWFTADSDLPGIQSWQFREWFSLFYPGMINTWLHVPKKNDNFLTISSKEILFNTQSALEKIIDFCNLTLDKDLVPFVAKWQSGQQYILQEYKTVCKIVQATVNKKYYSWSDLNIIAEAIVQQKLRQQGFEIKCDALNVFPTNSLDLNRLLEPNWRTE
jgi:hypothetical protein